MVEAAFLSKTNFQLPSFRGEKGTPICTPIGAPTGVPYFLNRPLPEPENVTRRLKNSLPDASENILTIDDVTSKSEKLKSVNTNDLYTNRSIF